MEASPKIRTMEVSYKRMYTLSPYIQNMYMYNIYKYISIVSKNKQKLTYSIEVKPMVVHGGSWLMNIRHVLFYISTDFTYMSSF